VAARVVMYSRRSCGLCDKARAVVLSVRDGSPFEFDELFIDGDDGLERAYGLRVPVLEVNGRDAFEYEVDPDELRALVGR
jgi:hypothetical protein